MAKNWKAAAGLVVGPGGLEEPATGVHLQKDTLYYLGASSSPKAIIVTKVSDDRIEYVDPYSGKRQTMERWIAADLITKGTTTFLRTHGRHVDPETKRSLQTLLAGKPSSKKEKLDDWQRVEWTFKAAPGYEDEDLWYVAEQYGSVGSVEKGGETLYEIAGLKMEVEKALNDQKLELVKKAKVASGRYSYDRR